MEATIQATDITPQLMAKALADFVLLHRGALDSLLKKYGINISGQDSMAALKRTEKMIQTQEGFAKDLLFAMNQRYQAFRNFEGGDNKGGGDYTMNSAQSRMYFNKYSNATGDGEDKPKFDFGGLLAGIFQGAGAVTAGVGSIINATSDTGKTMAQAELLKAQAQLQAQGAAREIAAGRQKAQIRMVLIVIGGVVILGMLAVGGIVLYKRVQKRKISKAV